MVCRSTLAVGCLQTALQLAEFTANELHIRVLDGDGADN